MNKFGGLLENKIFSESVSNQTIKRESLLAVVHPRVGDLLQKVQINQKLIYFFCFLILTNEFDGFKNKKSSKLSF